MTWLLMAVSLLINTPVPVVLPEIIFLSLVVAPQSDYSQIQLKYPFSIAQKSLKNVVIITNIITLNNIITLIN